MHANRFSNVYTGTAYLSQDYNHKLTADKSRITLVKECLQASGRESTLLRKETFQVSSRKFELSLLFKLCTV